MNSGQGFTWKTRPALFRIKLRIASTLRHETVLSTMNALLPFSSDCLLLDHRLSVRQVGVCLPFRDHSKAPAGPEGSDHRFALAGRLFSEFHLVRARSLHKKITGARFVRAGAPVAFDALSLFGRRLGFNSRRLRR